MIELFMLVVALTATCIALVGTMLIWGAVKWGAQELKITFLPDELGLKDTIDNDQENVR